jgi:hypothetical protein
LQAFWQQRASEKNNQQGSGSSDDEDLKMSPGEERESQLRAFYKEASWS